jgi:hypothetical protein
MHGQNRLAISSRSAALVAIVVVGAAAVIYFVSAGSPSAVISSSTFSSISLASPSASIGPSPGNQSPPPVLFGVANEAHVTTQTLPADTLAWTSWALNSSASIGVFEGEFFCPGEAVNSTITIGLYANGELVASQNASAAGKFSSSGGSILITSPLSSARTFSAGTVIALAVVAPVSIDQYVTTAIVGLQTKEAALNSGSGVPEQLPSPTSTISGAIQMWATPPIS